ncbi:hypothetical protein BGZ98_006692, partial [Dissophora globulifera]
MGVKYDRADKTRNYVETPDIKMKRRRYLQERYSAKYKGALFVWLDESYIHHHHVHNKSWFSDAMTVLRKNKSRLWCIIYAGSEDEWCKVNYPEKKVVFCMDNAKYHRREYQANPAQH